MVYQRKSAHLLLDWKDGPNGFYIRRYKGYYIREQVALLREWLSLGKPKRYLDIDVVPHLEGEALNRFAETDLNTISDKVIYIVDEEGTVNEDTTTYRQDRHTKLARKKTKRPERASNKTKRGSSGAAEGTGR